MNTYTLQLLHSLAKLLPGQKPHIEDLISYQWTALGDERTAIQIAVGFKWQEGLPARSNMVLKINSPISRHLDLYQVKLMPSELPAYPFYDDNYLTTTPGLLPDLLRKIPVGISAQESDARQWHIQLPADRTTVFWLETRLSVDNAGEHFLDISLEDESKTVQDRQEIQINVLPATIPEQALRRTEWFYADCLADYYDVAVFSEKHWCLIENFMRTAGEHGINTILTPIFTPPLDTAVGGERTTVQLVDVAWQDERWQFNFDKLQRWLDLAHNCGLKFIEISHLFTQWGANAAPKIMAWKNDKLQQIFGWSTLAAGPEYSDFLAQFLPILIRFLQNYGIADRCYFHISDEPSTADIPAYKAARDIAQPYLQDFPIIDALSDLSFYEEGIVDKPVPASDHIEPFLAANIPGLWTYYCCGQAIDVANCFMAMPSARVRVLGVQLYKYNIEGFLHWGYNFYNSQYSLRKIDPYRITDAGGAFPSGDAFLVYPGEDGRPEPSLRLKLLDQAISDLRALSLLEQLTSRKFVLDLIEEDLNQPLTFKEYPWHADWLLNLRHKVNIELKNQLFR